jgi:hypothetical protein
MIVKGEENLTGNEWCKQLLINIKSRNGIIPQGVKIYIGDSNEIIVDIKK